MGKLLEEPFEQLFQLFIRAVEHECGQRADQNRTEGHQEGLKQAGDLPEMEQGEGDQQGAGRADKIGFEKFFIHIA